MSHAIESITVNDLLDKRLVQRNGSCARKISIGNNWNTLDIGIRWASTDLGFDPSTGNIFQIGMMSNPSADVANGPAGNSTSHFVGVEVRTTTGIIRVASPTPHYSIFAATPMRRVGATTTYSGTGVGLGLVSAVPSIRTLLIVRIVKGSPNFTLSASRLNLADGLVDTPKELLIAAMEIADSAAARNNFLNNAIGVASAYTGSSASVAVDEDTDGPLNAIVLSWNRSVFPMIYSDVMWAQMA